jgi:hypothetical protein
MKNEIAADHPLRQLFSALVQRTFLQQLGVHEPGVPEYVSGLLVSFVHRDSIFRLRDARGRPLEEVAEMLMEGDVRLNATSFEREREVHKHIGDFTLFWTGIYPEMLRALRAPHRRDHLIDYVQQGRASYRIASTFTHGPYGQEAPVLRALSEEFELCMVGLNLVRRELDAAGDPQIRAARDLLSD